MSRDDKRSFAELLSPFLRGRLEALKAEHGQDSPAYLSLARQYLADEREAEIDFLEERSRHYQADVSLSWEGRPLVGVERLYRRVVILEPTLACLSHCRWCLRANYEPFTVRPEDLERFAHYAGSPANRDDLQEVLITGGDPLLVPQMVGKAMDLISRHAPNIHTIRIGSRLPMQDPGRVDEPLIQAISPRAGLRVEIGTHINAPVELCPETKAACRRLQEAGITIYSQHVLLRGVNDTLETQAELFNAVRLQGIEPHYLFHCIPLRGVSHHRTTIDQGLALIRALTSSGLISGRAKPMFTAMTDVGKVTLYDGVMIERRSDMVLLQTGYLHEDRLRWNPSWVLPDSAYVDSQGFLRVWYRDGQIHNKGWRPTAFLGGDH